MVPDSNSSPDQGDPKEPAPGGERRPILPDDHWSRGRNERNAEALDYLRERSRAPGVESGGSHRNSYCMNCGGVLALEYDSREPAASESSATCPHCGADVEPRVRAMFNWVELDQVPDGDLAALLPWILGAFVVLGLIAFAIFG